MQRITLEDVVMVYSHHCVEQNMNEIDNEIFPTKKRVYCILKFGSNLFNDDVDDLSALIQIFVLSIFI